MSKLEPQEHNLLHITESTEISHRQALIEFFEEMWPAYQQYGFTPGEAFMSYQLNSIYNQLLDVETAVKDHF